MLLVDSTSSYSTRSTVVELGYDLQDRHGEKEKIESTSEVIFFH